MKKLLCKKNFKNIYKKKNHVSKNTNNTNIFKILNYFLYELHMRRDKS